MSKPTDTHDEYERFVADADETHDGVYPELYNLSARFLFRLLPRPVEPAVPEFLYVPAPEGPRSGRRRLELTGLLAQWNSAWESAQLRQQMFGDELERRVPKLKGKIRGDANIFLFPDTKRRIDAYVPLYMLLPRGALARFGLPPLRRMLWPGYLAHRFPEGVLPPDAHRRLAAAFAAEVWPFLVSGSPQSAFRKGEPLMLLSHNLDFWLPHVVSVIQERLRAMDLVEFEDPDEADVLERIRRDAPPDVWVDRCRTGGHIWLGRDDARDALEETVAAADRDGRLSAFIDAVRRNRVEEDFSPKWSNAREDFERKLYSKRSKVRVRFVELEHAEGVVGPYSETTDALLWGDFLAVLDRKERQVAVCLTRGTTTLAEVAAELGYADHSPVSKALARIRTKIRQVLD